MTGRLRVLHCCYDDPQNPWVGGGGARRVFDLYRRLGDRVDVTIATGSYPGAKASRVDDLRVRRLGTAHSYMWSRLSYSASAMRVLRRADYDVAVVDHSAYAPVYIPQDRPVGITVHHLTGPTASGRWGRTVGGLIDRNERATIRRAKVLSATSVATARALRAIVDERTEIMPVASGVDERFFALTRRPRNYVLYIGRLDVSQKGLDVLLGAWTRVIRERPDLRLVIAGRGPGEGALKAKAASNGVSASVDFVGAVSDDGRDALLEGAQCQVMPSRFEGFGIAAIEALAAGVPLIVSDDPALAEIAADGAAVVVPRGNANALAEAIIATLRDGPGCAARAERGRVKAEQFRWAVVIESHLAYLCRIASQPAVTTPAGGGR